MSRNKSSSWVSHHSAECNRAVGDCLPPRAGFFSHCYRGKSWQNDIFIICCWDEICSNQCFTHTKSLPNVFHSRWNNVQTKLPHLNLFSDKQMFLLRPLIHLLHLFRNKHMFLKGKPASRTSLVAISCSNSYICTITSATISRWVKSWAAVTVGKRMWHMSKLLWTLRCHDTKHCYVHWVISTSCSLKAWSY